MQKNINYIFLERIILQIKESLSQKNFILFSAVLVGLSSGALAILLKLFVFAIHDYLFSRYQNYFHILFYVLFPIVGIIITVWIEQKFFEGKFLRGVSNILFAILKRSGIISSEQMYSHFITSSITVGFGGSAGLESPIVNTGAAIGSNYARKYQLSIKDRNLLLGCGAAAGIGAAFNAPVAGVLFAFEVLLAQSTIVAFIPLIMASASGALLSNIFLGDEILFNFTLKQPFKYINLPFYAILGLLCGFVSVYYAKSYLWVEGKISHLSDNPYKKAIKASFFLAALIFLLPSLFGEGYESIKHLANLNPEKIFEQSLFSEVINNPIILMSLLFATLLFKSIAASVTIGSGGNGGNFAPSLFTGAYLGFILAYIINQSGLTALPIANFTIVGMAGILSGVFYSPLTAIFLIAELTGGYELIIPLMIVSAIAFYTAKYIQKHNMDETKLSQKIDHFSHAGESLILSGLKTYKLIETDYTPINPNDNIKSLIKLIAINKKNVFPVISKNDKFLGIILLSNIRDILFNEDNHNKPIKDFMTDPPAIIETNEDIESVVKKFDETDTWSLPVLEGRTFKGFVSKASLLNHYRSVLQDNFN